MSSAVDTQVTHFGIWISLVEKRRSFDWMSRHRCLLQFATVGKPNLEKLHNSNKKMRCVCLMCAPKNRLTKRKIQSVTWMVRRQLCFIDVIKDAEEVWRFSPLLFSTSRQLITTQTRRIVVFWKYAVFSEVFENFQINRFWNIFHAYFLIRR